MKARVGFVDGSMSRNFGHRVIYWAQGGRFNPYAKWVHVFMNYGNLVHETTSSHYVERSLSVRMSGTTCDFFEVPGDPSKAFTFTSSLLGERYAYLDIAWFAFDCALGWVANSFNVLFGLPWKMLEPRKNPWNTSHHYCTEAVIKALGEMGEPTTFYDRAAGTRCPQLYKWCEKGLPRKVEDES